MNQPSKDGITHINVYSQGRTALGRFLSNWTHAEIITIDGKFQSVEGYWYWLGKRDDRLRDMHGYEAKKFGKSLKEVTTLDPIEFKTRIKKAINYKITHSKFLKEFTSSTLPFDHYYVFNDIAKNAGFRWIIEHLEKIRVKLNALDMWKEI
jgi:hypothetical protein